MDAGLITYPVFVKPARGSASISISKVYDRETVELLFAHEDGLMIQEFLDGQEIGADVYIDMISHEVVYIFTKKKLKMCAGETDKAVSFHDPFLLLGRHLVIARQAYTTFKNIRAHVLHAAGDVGVGAGSALPCRRDEAVHPVHRLHMHGF